MRGPQCTRSSIIDPSPSHSREPPKHRSTSHSCRMAAASTVRPALLFRSPSLLVKMATTPAAAHAMVSPAHWTLSVLSLFCHPRCTSPPSAFPVQQFQRSLLLRLLGLLLTRKLQPLHLHQVEIVVVAAAMCWLLMLCLKTLHRDCPSAGRCRSRL